MFYPSVHDESFQTHTANELFKMAHTVVIISTALLSLLLLLLLFLYFCYLTLHILFYAVYSLGKYTSLKFPTEKDVTILQPNTMKEF